MTGEEARQVLQTKIDNSPLFKDERDAFIMAIDALQTDAVSREEYDDVKAYTDKLVDAFIEDGEELADSVKVVRCMDCIWGKEWNDKQIFCDRILMRLRENDFCSYGERRK